MPNFRSETAFGSGDSRWIGTRHAINTADTAMVDISAFTAATHFPDGFLPSGTVVGRAANRDLVPWDGLTAIAGHILWDQSVKGTEDFAVPLYVHGEVNAEFVPGDFTIPTDPALLAATTIVYK